MSQALTHRCPALPVTVVEPSAGMRIALFTNMAGDPVMRDRVRVLPIAGERIDLVGGYDLALCTWAMRSFAPRARPDIWSRIRRSLVPGGAFLFARPPRARPTPLTLEEHELDRARVGSDVVVLNCSTRPTGSESQDWTFRYRHLDQRGQLVQEWVGGGESWLVGDEDLVTELTAVGFTIERTLPDLETSDAEGNRPGEVYMARAV